MLSFSLTERRAGVVLWGDTWALRRIYDLASKLNDESALIENKEGLLMSLCYDLRKAYEGHREKSERVHFDDVCPIYGVSILWPALVAQIGVMREAMAFVSTDRLDQAVMYELEHVVEQAARELLPGQDRTIMSEMQRMGSHGVAYVEKVLDSRCRFFLHLPASERAGLLPMVLKSFDPMYSVLVKAWAQSGVDETIPLVVLENLMGREEEAWPDIKW